MQLNLFYLNPLGAKVVCNSEIHIYSYSTLKCFELYRIAKNLGSKKVWQIGTQNRFGSIYTEENQSKKVG